ncbi:ABC transporter substrate-binding protein [Aeoliella sp.]|uniref:ABC transporter substrate-binding protein n=1 Tax=Aeoliella sp. TaxID=2795800 RepID=UPI003CCC080D
MEQLRTIRTAIGWWLVGIIAFIVATPTALAESTADDLVFGMSTALSGPAAELGRNMKQGVEAALAEANRQGGVRGKELRLVALDDGYEPNRTAPNMHLLIEDQQVLAVVGNVGTPTAVVAEPIATSRQTLFYGAYTGAGVLRKSPPERFVINYRASYSEETSAMVDSLIEHFGLQPEQIAFFTQRDAFGDAGYIGAVQALERHGLADETGIVHGRYERNTVAVENALADILMAPEAVRAVIMVGAYEPCAAFIRLAKSTELQAVYLNVSFVGAEPLAEALGEQGDGVIVTQVVPHYDSHLPAVQRYHVALQEFDPSARPSFGSLEGYLSTQVLLTGLRRMEGPIDRRALAGALEDLGEFDIGLGETLSYSPQDHQASHHVWPTVIRAGRVQQVDWAELPREVSAP